MIVVNVDRLVGIWLCCDGDALHIRFTLLEYISSTE